MTVAACRAGIAYFVAVFTAGCLLGTIRVLVLIPRSGERWSVLLEVPVMLAVSWWASRWLIERLHVRNRVVDRANMGVTAFVLLMTAELGLAVFAFQRSAADHFASYRSPEMAFGLAAQIVFALIPLIQGWSMTIGARASARSRNRGDEA